MAGSIDKLIERMKYWCTSVSLGYDQSNRQDFRNGGETDCSALVIYALKEAGFDTGSATYTGNMRSQLTARGWKVMPVNGNPKAGDILLNDVNHVAVYIGDGKLAQASIDERGKATGGQGGDQSGRETNISNYYNYPWNCYLRYTGKQEEVEEVESADDDDKLEEDGYRGPLTIKKWQKVLGTSPIDGVISKPKSNLILAWQKFLNSKGYDLEEDGSEGPLTIKAAQKYLKSTPADGITSSPSNWVKALQRKLNTGKL